MPTIPINELPVGQSGRLENTRDEAAPQRLRELGFVPGTTVTMVRRGLFGDPLEVELRGYRICLRRADLACMRVTLEDSPA